MTRDEILKQIFEEDTFGLLNLKPKTTQRNANDRLLASFQLIIDFYETNSREPEKVADIQECDLFYKLNGLRENAEKKAYLKEFDEYGLLDLPPITEPIPEPKEYKTIDDILHDDDFGLLDADDSIYTLKHVSSADDRTKTDFVARRKPCKDFSKYEALFKQCQKDLKEGNRRFVKFSEDDIKEGSFFVVDGMLAYVSEVYEISKDKHSKLDGRIRCIFENGTESNLLFRSLGKALYKNGQSITQLLNKEDLIISHINSDDKETGYIYILKSKSTKPEIREVPNLYKIGFSTTPVDERIKNALQEPTYLMSEVALLASYKCYNLSPQRFEYLVHSFFGKVCLSLDVYDAKGNRHTPREWFSVPYNIIEQTIALIIKGEISNYRYDEEREVIVENKG